MENSCVIEQIHQFFYLIEKCIRLRLNLSTKTATQIRSVSSNQSKMSILVPDWLHLMDFAWVDKYKRSLIVYRIFSFSKIFVFFLGFSLLRWDRCCFSLCIFKCCSLLQYYYCLVLVLSIWSKYSISFSCKFSAARNWIACWWWGREKML